ncbi:MULTISPECIES: hypothetical protein [Xanthomonas]|uniref:hypothetical protein n=1 Tax=Xanthomonas TaxID=338 RepID=UPI00096F62C7|nr:MULTISPECIES: hypothetical protein [Xanthomonas]MCC5091482.1 hypothetical protein [Xanthomonas campestris pv. incanae]MEA9611086.1 hypothetical protein [Xanthomonas campestris pv. incanae]MEA9618200.1 hypothetical protein [Xanthomonas campestris pv. incanae]MEA9796271.1 hypothetical protein [Xanthomonas campestris pv. raphani]RFF43456.1 hypothetical protein D0A38_14400 [Xanthomonas campestris pv. incanae]
MLRSLVTCLLILTASSAAAAPAATCQESDNLRFDGLPLSIVQMEQIGVTYAAKNTKAPQVPFAYGNKDWLWLKKQYRSGDYFVAYEQLWPVSGKPFAWGYALVRGQCVLGVLNTRTS